MNKQSEINKIKQNFMLKRMRAQEECDEYISSLRENTEFNQLYSSLIKKQLDLLKKEYSSQNAKLKHEIENLKQKLEQYLKSNNIDKSKLTPHYDCELCQDTGIYQGKMCKCLLNELNYNITMKTSSQQAFSSFKDCDLNLMDETDIKTKDVLLSWCDKFPNVSKININIIGGVGTGKTFLLECVATELINKSVAVCYKTAFEINELARLYHIGKSYEFSDCLNAEVLLIDDLGSEPILKNITKEYFYNLINARQIHNLPTIISTNLSLDNILNRYDDRIFSRLANKKLSMNICLTSQDKRIR